MSFAKLLTNEVSTKVEDDLVITVLKGNTNDYIERGSFSGVVNRDIVTTDTESANVVCVPIRTIIAEGKAELSWEWETDISESDITRFVSLNDSDALKSSSNFSQSTVADAVSNKKFVMNVEYDPIFSELGDLQIRWQLKTNGKIKALTDNTKFLCTITNNSAYQVKILDIPVGATKTVARQGTINYLVFAQDCSVGGTTLSENTFKKLSSNSVDVKNESSKPCRIVTIYK